MKELLKRYYANSRKMSELQQEQTKIKDEVTLRCMKTNPSEFRHHATIRMETATHKALLMYNRVTRIKSYDDLNKILGREFLQKMKLIKEIRYRSLQVSSKVEGRKRNKKRQ